MTDVKKPLNHRQRQALATQALILDSASTLFLEQGYGLTTIDAISLKAGVAVSTVYALYKNKRGILKAIRDDWHDESGQRDVMRRALQETDPAHRLELAAHAARRQWETGARMIAIYESAAAVDPEARDELNEALGGRRRHLTEFVQQTAGMLRSGVSAEHAAAIFLALTQAAVYQELVGVFGWSPDDYEPWLASSLKQQLLP